MVRRCNQAVLFLLVAIIAWISLPAQPRIVEPILVPMNKLVCSPEKEFMLTCVLEAEGIDYQLHPDKSSVFLSGTALGALKRSLRERGLDYLLRDDRFDVHGDYHSAGIVAAEELRLARKLDLVTRKFTDHKFIVFVKLEGCEIEYSVPPRLGAWCGNDWLTGGAKTSEPQSPVVKSFQVGQRRYFLAVDDDLSGSTELLEQACRRAVQIDNESDFHMITKPWSLEAKMIFFEQQNKKSVSRYRSD